MKCAYCLKDFEENSYVKGQTYKAIDYHHSPPVFTFHKDNIQWSGDLIPLCRDCHVSIHKEIKNILFTNSTLLKFINSEEWLWNYILPINREKARNEILLFTRKWIQRGSGDGDSKSD